MRKFNCMQRFPAIVTLILDLIKKLTDNGLVTVENLVH